MKLERVTITGADDSVKPSDLISLQQKYPFVEWAILFSNAKQGQPRYPSVPWLLELENKGLRLAAHLCGSLVRDVVAGKWTFASNWSTLCPSFSRIQLNFAPYLRFMVYEDFVKGLKSIQYPWQFIFQLHGTSSKLIDICLEANINFGVLYDISGGKGILPEKWPKPSKVFTGYAGGLSPENLAVQLDVIEQQIGDSIIWIDTESRVRSEDNLQFDLNKVEQFLQVASKYVVKCEGCGRFETHKMCPAWGTPLYLSGELFTQDDEIKYADQRKEAIEKSKNQGSGLD